MYCSKCGNEDMNKAYSDDFMYDEKTGVYYDWWTCMICGNQWYEED